MQKMQPQNLEYTFEKEKARLQEYLIKYFIPYLETKLSHTNVLRERFQYKLETLQERVKYLAEHKGQMQSTEQQSYLEGVIAVSTPYLNAVQYRLEAKEIEEYIAETKQMLDKIHNNKLTINELSGINDLELIYAWGKKVGLPQTTDLGNQYEENAMNISSTGSILSVSTHSTSLGSANEVSFSPRRYGTSETIPMSGSTSSLFASHDALNRNSEQQSNLQQQCIQLRTLTNEMTSTIDIKYTLLKPIIFDKFWDNQQSSGFFQSKQAPKSIESLRQAKNFQDLLHRSAQNLGQEQSNVATQLLRIIITAEYLKDTVLEKKLEDFQNEHMVNLTQQQQSRQSRASSRSGSGINGALSSLSRISSFDNQ